MYLMVNSQPKRVTICSEEKSLVKTGENKNDGSRDLNCSLFSLSEQSCTEQNGKVDSGERKKEKRKEKRKENTKESAWTHLYIFGCSGKTMLKVAESS